MSLFTSSGQPKQGPLTVYTAESALRRPGQLLRQMVGDAWAGRRLAWRLFVRDVRAQYRQSLLGLAWAFLPPLLATAVFLLLNRADILPEPRGALPSALFILVGILYWQLFADLMAAPLAMVEGAKNLVGKVAFPREALVAAAFAKSLFTFAIRLLVLAGFTIGLGYAPSFTAVPLMLLAVVPVAALGLFCGVLVVIPGLLFKDFGQGLALVTTALLFLTPVGYDAGPLATAPAYVRWNPLSYLIEMPRALFAGTPVEQLDIVSLILVASLTALALEWVAFRVSFPIVVERMGA